MTITRTETDVARAPEIPFRVISSDDVRASIKRAKQSLEKAAEEIVWQIEMEAWVTLGYRSWSAMREAEYGGAAFMVPSKQRPELVARMRARGLTQREIANTAGVTHTTVRRDLEQMFQGDPTQKKADPVEPVVTITCPTCNGTGRITQ